LANHFTIARGINNLGQIVGYYLDNANKPHGFLLSGGANPTYTTLDVPWATEGTRAFGINDMGQIVGTYETGNGIHAFLYSGGLFSTIDDPAVNSPTNALGINNNIQVVGFFGDRPNENHGFLETSVPNTPPPAGTTADMVLRGAATSPVPGQYEIYDIGSNSILAAYSLGQVGTDWTFVTLAGFFGSDTTDMLLRNGKTGGFEVYDIANNNITNAAFLGNVGLDWQVMGFGNFSSFGETEIGLGEARFSGAWRRCRRSDGSAQAA